MTSRLGDYGPSALTVDHVIGSNSKLVVSPHHASAMATNNFARGVVSARAAGNVLVKGSIDSLDPNGRGVLKVQVPGKAEVKSTLHGVGRVELEATNGDPSAGHARVQADFAGYGWAEAQASQERFRPDILVAHRFATQQPPNPGHPSQFSQQQGARTPPTQGTQRNPETSDPSPPEQSQPRRSRRRAGRRPSKSE